MASVSSARCLVSLLVGVFASGGLASAQAVAAFESASASSQYPSGAFDAGDALRAGSGFWCSAGSHAPGQSVTWIGKLSTAQQAIGMSLHWAYGPGEFRVLTSADGGNFEEAAAWRAPTRAEVSYKETVMFSSPRRVKAVAVVMRSPMPWGYFGINDASMLVEPGTSMLVSKAQGEEDLCLMAKGGELAVSPCLDAIAVGLGDEIFNFNSKSQLVSAKGKCVSMGLGHVGLEECEALLDASDGSGTFAVTPEGQLKCQAGGSYCLAASAGVVSAAPCTPSGEGGDFILTAVPELDPTAAARALDAVSLLKASAARQGLLLKELKAKMSACKSLVQTNATGHVDSSSILLTQGLDTKIKPLDAQSIDQGLGMDLVAVKALVAESQALLTSLKA